MESRQEFWKSGVREKVIRDLKAGTSSSFAEFLESGRKKAFYGQGGQASICFDFCSRLGIGVEAFLGNSESCRMAILPKEIPFWKLNHIRIDKQEYDILIAVNEKHNSEIRSLLKEWGFHNIYYSDDWNKTNDEYRTSFLDCFLKREMGDAYHSNDEIIEWYGFKIWNVINQPRDYKTMFQGEFFDIIAPSIWGCKEYLLEGAYESEGGGIFRKG